MMPMSARRKTRDMEKVENLCRTATAWKILPAPEQAGSSLRDSMRAERMARAIQHRYAGDAGEAARHQRHDPGRGQQADLERAEAAAQSVACEEGDGARWSATSRNAALAGNESFRRGIL